MNIVWHKKTAHGAVGGHLFSCHHTTDQFQGCDGRFDAGAAPTIGIGVGRRRIARQNVQEGVSVRVYGCHMVRCLLAHLQGVLEGLDHGEQGGIDLHQLWC